MWLETLREILIHPALVAILTGSLGFLAKVLWDLWFSERVAPTSRLLERFSSNTLGNRGRLRLQKEVEQILAVAKQRNVPNNVGSNSVQILPNRDAIIIRSTDVPAALSSCPSGDPTQAGSPLFIALDGTDLPTLQSEFERALVRLVPLDIDRRLLREVGGLIESNPKVWVLTHALIIRSTDDLANAFQQLSNVIREHIIGTILILELYLADDICDVAASMSHVQIIRSTNSPSALAITGNRSLAAVYAQSRNSAAALLKSGLVLGDPSPPAIYSVPEAVIHSRLEGDATIRLLEKREWTTLTLSGPPGSGKTATAAYIASELARQRMLVLCFCTPELLDALVHFTAKNRSKFIQQIADCLKSVYPDEFTDSQQSRDAFEDVLLRQLWDNSVGFVVLADDLDFFGEARSALARMRQNAAALGVRFVLVSRNRLEKVHGEQLESATTKHWSVRAAISIVKHWKPKRLDRLTTQLTDGQLSRYPRSTYFLRLMCDFWTEGKEESSDLLAEAVSRWVSGLASAFPGKLSSGQLETAESVLNRVRQLVLSNRPHNELIELLNRRGTVDKTATLSQNVVRTLAEMSWMSRFEPVEVGKRRRGTFSASDVSMWLGDRISVEEAESILREGARIEVFKYFSRLASWADNFIPDACSAIYLRDDIESQKWLLLCEMIERMVDQGSAEILRIALSADKLISLFTGLAGTRMALLPILDEILSPDYLEWLNRSPAAFEDLAGILIDSDTEISERVNLAPLLLKFSEYSGSVESRIHQLIAKDDPRTSLAIATMATKWKDNGKYFEQMEKAKASPGKVLEMAGRVWTRRGLEPLVEELFRTWQTPNRDDALYSWQCWCERQSATDLIDDVKLLSRREIIEHVTAERLSAVIGRALKVVTQGPRLSNETIQPLFDIIPGLQKNDRTLLAAEIVRWLAYHYGRDFLTPDAEWVISPDGTFGVLKDPREPLLVKEIIARVYIHRRFRLPSSEELSTATSIRNSSELVSNKLPSDYAGETVMPSGALVAWDGVQATPVSSFDAKMRVFHWRPRFALSR